MIHHDRCSAARGGTAIFYKWNGKGREDEREEPELFTKAVAYQIITDMSKRIQDLFPGETIDIILFGSYARNEETDESDIDVIYLVDASKATISDRNWQIGEAAADLIMEYGVVISPIVENREYFQRNADVLPFFANIRREGVRISA